MTESLLLCCGWIVLIMLIWFESDAFEYYVRYFNLHSWFGVHVYDKEDPDHVLDYLSFLRVKYKGGSFVVALVTCQTCLSVWLSVIFCLAFDLLYFFPLVNLFSLLVYLLIGKIFYANGN